MNKPVTTAGGPGDGGRIIDEPLTEALSRRYLAYALSTITDRALPDVRDGLKPVQRRVLYAMREMRLDPDDRGQQVRQGGRRRDGRATTRTATSRSTTPWCAWPRTSPSAIRWSTARATSATSTAITPRPCATPSAKLTEAATLLLDGIDEDAVDFQPTYDGEDEEPVVLPAGFPNLLANGSTGIAVGMATSIPPHNAAELIDACLLLLDNARRHHRRPDGPRAGPGLPHRRRDRRAAALACSRPTRPAAAACACAPRWNKEDTRPRRPTRSSSPRSPTR